MSKHSLNDVLSGVLYPREYRGAISQLLGYLLDQVSQEYPGTKRYQLELVDVINRLVYMVLSGDTYPTSLDLRDLFHTAPLYEIDDMKDLLGDLYMDRKYIDFSQMEICTQPQTASKQSSNSKSVNTEPTKTIKTSGKLTTEDVSTATVCSEPPTPKTDLYIQPPTIPQFDSTKPWASTMIDGTLYSIYESYPKVPIKQNQISVTTDVNLFSDSDLMRLYPNRFIRTRAPIMYSPVDGLDYDDMLGIILPIDGFSREALIDNLIKYPHIFKLCRVVDGVVESMYSKIEIDGELVRIMSVWDDLPDTQYIPRTKDFVKEYVVRRFLLERDVYHIDHRYSLHGSLDPFLTLFMPPEGYIDRGYTNVVRIARSCVEARVSYKQTRNPIISRMLVNE